MKQNTQIILTITLTFMLLYATSFLLDWQVISKSITRIVITILLMIIELLIGFLILKHQIKI